MKISRIFSIFCLVAALSLAAGTACWAGPGAQAQMGARINASDCSGMTWPYPTTTLSSHAEKMEWCFWSDLNPGNYWVQLEAHTGRWSLSVGSSTAERSCSSSGAIITCTVKVTTAERVYVAATAHETQTSATLTNGPGGGTGGGGVTPNGCCFDGVWQTKGGEIYTCDQSGNSVTCEGQYWGRIQGTVTGKTLNGTWQYWATSNPNPPWQDCTITLNTACNGWTGDFLLGNTWESVSADLTQAGDCPVTTCGTCTTVGDSTDRFEDAVQVNYNACYNAYLDPVQGNMGEVDLYRFSHPGGALTLYSSGNASLNGFLYDANENFIISDQDSGDGEHFKISTTVAAGTYVLEVIGDDASAYGDYTIYLGCDGTTGGGGSTAAGQPCTTEDNLAGVYDCAGKCADNELVSIYINDGLCDDGTWFFNFNCSAFNYDGGDCSQ